MHDDDRERIEKDSKRERIAKDTADLAQELINESRLCSATSEKLSIAIRNWLIGYGVGFIAILAHHEFRLSDIASQKLAVGALLVGIAIQVVAAIIARTGYANAIEYFGEASDLMYGLYYKVSDGKKPEDSEFPAGNMPKLSSISTGWKIHALFDVATLLLYAFATFWVIVNLTAPPAEHKPLDSPPVNTKSVEVPAKPTSHARPPVRPGTSPVARAGMNDQRLDYLAGG